MQRKDFLAKIIVGGSVLLVAPAYLSSCSKSSDSDFTTATGGDFSGATIDLTQSEFTKLGTVGGYIYFQNLIIVHVDSSQYVALSKTCTHQGCTVDYSSSAKQIVCPCHGAHFSLDGSVLSGPAKQPLTKYTVTINNKTLKIS